MTSTEDNACLDWRNCSDEEKYNWLVKKNGGDIKIATEKIYF